MNKINSYIQKSNLDCRHEPFISTSLKKILMIDSETEFVQLIVDFLGQEGYGVTVSDDNLKALQEAKSGKYQLILLDIILPNANGFELLKQLRASNEIPIMILTSRNDLFDKIYSLELGADDYLIKSVNQRELLARINVIFRRIKKSNYQNIKEETFINGISLSVLTREVFCENKVLNLTGHEFEVLHYLMLNAGNIMSKDDIVENIHGRSMLYNDRSIDMHIYNLRKKIAKFSDTQKIKTIRGAGYIFLKKSI